MDTLLQTKNKKGKSIYGIYGCDIALYPEAVNNNLKPGECFRVEKAKEGGSIFRVINENWIEIVDRKKVRGEIRSLLGKVKRLWGKKYKNRIKYDPFLISLAEKFYDNYVCETISDVIFPKIK